MKYLILNDLHLGLRRGAGTPAEKVAKFAEDIQLPTFERILNEHTETPVLVLGDLFDSGAPGYDALRAAWSLLRYHAGGVVLVKGNHDITKDRSQKAGIDFLGELLGVDVLSEPGRLDNREDVWVVPHLANQQRFDEALAQARDAGARIVLTHCNFDNPFAAEKVHSLNLSPEQAGWFDKVISGHEHNNREIGNVSMLGAQVPFRIDEVVPKFYHVLDLEAGQLTQCRVEMSLPVAALQMDWRELDLAKAHIGFVRVTGSANISEADTVAKLVQAFRRDSAAYFVTNSVEVSGIELGAVFDGAAEDLERFEAKQELFNILPQEQMAYLRELIEKYHLVGPC